MKGNLDNTAGPHARPHNCWSNVEFHLSRASTRNDVDWEKDAGAHPLLGQQAYTDPERPSLCVNLCNGTHRPIDDEDYSPSVVSGSESGQSDFATIVTVNDFGFAASFQRQVRRYSFRNYAAVTQSLPDTRKHIQEQEQEDQHAPGCRKSLDSVPLAFSRLGEKFSDDPPTPIASAVEVDDFLEDQFRDDITEETLYNELCNEYAMSHHSSSEQEFIPQDKLFTIVDNHNVRYLLMHTFPNDDKDQIDTKIKHICSEDHRRSRRMILATLILIKKVAYIEDFIRHDICDIHLPLRRSHVKDRKIAAKWPFHRRIDVAGMPSLTCFHHWDHKDMRDFVNFQYDVLTPFLEIGGDRVCFYKIEDKIRLPFIEYNREQDGGHGTVWKAKIHPAHHNSQSSSKEYDSNPYFAVKAIYSEDYDRYREEVQVLERFSGAATGHPHLIRLLMAFQHGRKYYLIFPWATGNLVDLWKNDPLPSQSAGQARWFMDQCLGMAEGLKKIHRHWSWDKDKKKGDGSGETRGHQGRRNLGAGKNLGRHGDIKPENILWFQLDDRLIIADFGLTRFHSSEGKSELTTPDKLRGLSRTYRPPEADLRGPLRQTYDVWSLACLYLEFITWYLVGYEMTRGQSKEGHQQIKTFQDVRLEDDISPNSSYPEDKFFNLEDSRRESLSEPVRYTADVKQSVKDWIAYLRGVDQCSQFACEFLDLIETEMLVPDSQARAHMGTVCYMLKKIKLNCYDDERYCISRIPKPTTRRASKAQPAIGELRRSMGIQNDAIHPLPDDNDLSKFIGDQLSGVPPASTESAEAASHFESNIAEMAQCEQPDENALDNLPQPYANSSSSSSTSCNMTLGRIQSISGRRTPQRHSTPGFLLAETTLTTRNSQNSVTTEEATSSVATSPAFSTQNSREELQPRSKEDNCSVHINGSGWEPERTQDAVDESENDTAYQASTVTHCEDVTPVPDRGGEACITQTVMTATAPLHPSQDLLRPPLKTGHYSHEDSKSAVEGGESGEAKGDEMDAAQESELSVVMGVTHPKHQKWYKHRYLRKICSPWSHRRDRAIALVARGRG